MTNGEALLAVLRVSRTIRQMGERMESEALDMVDDNTQLDAEDIAQIEAMQSKVDAFVKDMP